MLKLNSEKDEFGCKHYKRSCMKQCPDEICAGKFWPCRLCHDEVCYEQEMNPKKNHQFNRKEVTHVKCLRCGQE